MLWIVLSVLQTLDPRDCYTALPSKLLTRCLGEDITITPTFVNYPSPPVLDWTNIPGDGRHRVLGNGTLVIRNRDHPWGIPGAPANEQEKLDVGNRCLRAALALARAAQRAAPREVCRRTH